MKWVVVILIMCGLFYAAKRLMPSPSTIDVNWMLPQIKQGMSEDEVKQAVGGDPTTVMSSGLGHDETWYYTDRYNQNNQLAIQFIDGRVYSKEIESVPAPQN